MWHVRYPTTRGGGTYVKQVYLFIICTFFIELAIVTVVAIALFVALIVAMRKLDNKKHISANR